MQKAMQAERDGASALNKCDHAIALCLALAQDGRIYQLITVRNNFLVARLSTSEWGLWRSRLSIIRCVNRTLPPIINEVSTPNSST